MNSYVLSLGASLQLRDSTRCFCLIDFDKHLLILMILMAHSWLRSCSLSRFTKLQRRCRMSFKSSKCWWATSHQTPCFISQQQTILANSLEQLWNESLIRHSVRFKTPTILHPEYMLFHRFRNVCRTLHVNIWPLRWGGTARGPSREKKCLGGGPNGSFSKGKSMDCLWFQ